MRRFVTELHRKYEEMTSMRKNASLWGWGVWNAYIPLKMNKISHLKKGAKCLIFARLLGKGWQCIFGIFIGSDRFWKALKWLTLVQSLTSPKRWRPWTYPKVTHLETRVFSQPALLKFSTLGVGWISHNLKKVNGLILDWFSTILVLSNKYKRGRQLSLR